MIRARDWTYAAVEAFFGDSAKPNRRAGQSAGVIVPCPVHADDANPSCSIQPRIPSPENPRDWFVHCFACADDPDFFPSFLAALNGEVVEQTVVPKNGRPNRQVRCGPAVAEYEYSGLEDPDAWDYGDLVKVRYSLVDQETGEVVGKTFKWKHAIDDGWAAGLPAGIHADLYRCDDIPSADVVLLCEGEKDADAAAEAIMLEGPRRTTFAVSMPNGAASDWLPGHVESLRGKHVWTVFDNDAAGRKAETKVYRTLLPVAASIRVLHAAEGVNDLADHLAAGYRLDDLVEVILPTTAELAAQPINALIQVCEEHESFWCARPWLTDVGPGRACEWCRPGPCSDTCSFALPARSGQSWFCRPPSAESSP